MPDRAFEGLSVLVVDDNAVNRRILEEMLTTGGCGPPWPTGPESALADLERAREAGTPFALVLIDAMMPGMDGFALAERIKADPRPVEKVLLMLTSPDRAGAARRSRRGDHDSGGATVPA